MLQNENRTRAREAGIRLRWGRRKWISTLL